MTSVEHLSSKRISEVPISCPLFIDLHTSIRFAMSSLELEGWIDQARRACRFGSLTQSELEALLETAQYLATELMER